MKLQIIPATMSLAPNKIVSFVKYGNTNSGSNSIPLLLVKIAGSFQTQLRSIPKFIRENEASLGAGSLFLWRFRINP
jgi:hypothetical protein